MPIRRLTILPTLLWVTLTSLPGWAQDLPAWEHQSSDIPADSRISFGSLANGVRFAWMANSQPEQRCYLRLFVEVGSLVEEDSERGMAHFLEHMAFNGLRGYPGATLLDRLREQGMRIGPDSNARTTLESTVYKIDLLVSEPSKVLDALQILRGFADGMLLRPEAVERVKGVIDAEERERSSPDLRTFQQEASILYAGSRIPRRFPIGLAQVRRDFTTESLRAFYHKWYRPEHMVVVVVGDLGESNPESLIREAFGRLEAPAGPLPTRPERGDPDFQRRYFAVHEPALASSRISLSHLRRWRGEADTSERRIQEMILVLSRSMLNERLARLAESGEAPYTQASAGSAAAFRFVEGERLSIESAPDQWRQALAAAELELRRVLQHGFQEAEVNKVKADFLRGLSRAAERAGSRPSPSYAERILAAAGAGVVPSSVETDFRLLKPAIERLTPEDCRAALARSWAGGVELLGLTGSPDLGASAPGLLEAALRASRAVPAERSKPRPALVFAHHSDPDLKGKIAERTHIADLGLHQVRFENGVRINIKKTGFKEKEILIEGWLGEGLLSLEPSRAALSVAASRVFGLFGLQDHSPDDLRRILAGKQVTFNFSVTHDHFGFKATTTRDDLLAQCELLSAYLTHSGWRPEAMSQFKELNPRIYQRLRHSLQGPLQAQFLPALHGGDPRFGLPPQEEVDAITVEAVRGWLEPQLEEAPLEVTFVGDLEVDELIRSVARTFGTLPPRRPLRSYQERRHVEGPRSGLHESYPTATTDPNSMVYVAFPTTDGLDASTRRGLAFLSRLLANRLRTRVRQNLGAAYETSTSSMPSRTYPGLGFLTLQVLCEPEKAPEMRDLLLDVAQQLSDQGVTEQEVDRLRQQILSQLRGARGSNGFWLTNIAGSQRRPERLDDLRGLIPFYSAVSAHDVDVLARTYLQKEKASSAVIFPR